MGQIRFKALEELISNSRIISDMLIGGISWANVDENDKNKNIKRNLNNGSHNRNPHVQNARRVHP